MTAEWILARLVAGKPVQGRHVVVVAHADDEVIAFGGALCCLDDVQIVQLTDAGAPRRQERAAAQIAAGWRIPVVDGGVETRHVHEHAGDLLGLVRDAVAGAEVVWTHPYEGGHLDHDSAAWLVQTACAETPLRMEFASYHATGAAQVFGAFWPDPSVLTGAAVLTGDHWARKSAALAAYGSQAHILRKFLTPAIEPYRVAPVYDFRRPPPPARCRWDWKGYQPPTSVWRTVIAEAERLAVPT